MLATTLPDLNTLDREKLEALLVAEHQELALNADRAIPAAQEAVQNAQADSDR